MLSDPKMTGHDNLMVSDTEMTCHDETYCAHSRNVTVLHLTDQQMCLCYLSPLCIESSVKNEKNYQYLMETTIEHMFLWADTGLFVHINLFYQS